MKKIAFLIRELSYGGAEKQLVTLAKALDVRGFDVTVLCFYPNGAFEKDFTGTTVKIVSLEKQGRWDAIAFLGRLLSQLRRIQPDVLHTYLPDSNVIAIFLKPFLPKTKIIWGIRHSNWGIIQPNQKKDKQFVNWDGAQNTLLQLERKLARFADLIIVNSYAGQKYHLLKGFPAENITVIPNGIDIDRFQINPQARLSIRKEWDILPNTILIGLVGRLAPMKDHTTFLQAAALLCQERQDLRFVCIGKEQQPDYAKQIYELTKQLGISDRVIWTGARSDMTDIYNALDIVVSTSAYGEGFSNAIGEAMACGKPCIVTDVGDSAWILGNQGFVIPPGKPQALQSAVLQLIMEMSLGNYTQSEVRQRIVENFSVPQLLQKTESNLLSLFNHN
ncbi:glycosyltransferase [Calothrix sp. UHCC 0171]|uniref:glycosyltransferase n=1 Tax=Calothrix sp. UHCC 0171 TaxID=3110245 RepID=UPI002B21AF21|nr:glycosyltransferase [Calothrix sp. UHCC 0171]MEA5571824.1 glycosyltransferase [Calothrix sp. UHCC 0171]